MNNIFFFQTKQISDSSIFNQFKEQKIFFSYFQVDQNYYLFLFSQKSIKKSIDINFLYQSIDVIEELDSKQRKLRSFRGFFLYALEIIEAGKDYEILTTNLQPFFWRKIKNIIRQNQKGLLLEFLFGKELDTKDDNKGSNSNIQILQDQIQTLKIQVDSLEQKISELESKLQENTKYALSEPSRPLESSKTIQQVNYTIQEKKAPYLTENDPKRSSAGLSEIKDSTYQTKDIESTSKIPFKAPFQPYNISSEQSKPQNQSNFITLSNLSEDEKIEIIQRGFQLNQQAKISLKKYYESKDPSSLFQWKGYSIKYETIRRTSIYKSLKSDT